MSRRPLFRRAARAAFAATLTTSVVGAALVLPAPAQALSSPGGLTAVTTSAAPVLSWNRIGKATSYRVQVDNDPGFGSPEYEVTTSNDHAVPTTWLPPGETYWRVKALKPGAESSWTSSSFTISALGTPVLTAPADGASLAQPAKPPLLRWDTSKGATEYIVELDGDEDFVGAQQWRTQTTSFVVPEPLGVGDWFWRVTAIKQRTLLSQPSVPRSFVIEPLVEPTITFPANNVNVAMEDVVFDWKPVPGARTYDLQVALDSTFNNFALDISGITSSRFSPATTLNNDQFWWRVRAVDLAGNPSPWAESTLGFKRNWLDKPAAIYPKLAVSGVEKPYFQWTPVQHASYYELYVADDANMSVNLEKCTVAGTTWATGRPNTPRCNWRTGTFYWQVRAMDQPYERVGLPGIFSTVQEVTWSGPVPQGTFSGTFEPVTGLKVSLTGQGATDPAKGCADVACQDVPATPVLSWDPQPGIDYYQVYVAQDENFTTSELPSIPTTTNSMLTIRPNDDVSALPESQAGLPYFWYVRPCVTGVGCGPSPVSQDPPLPGAHSFEKESPAVKNLVAVDDAGSPTSSLDNDIEFSWQDYYTTNVSTAWKGETGHQTALQYHLQVNTEPTFTGKLLDEAVVDQATYTAWKKHYPEGTLYWRVQALDHNGNPLTWSPTQTITKKSPQVVLTSPVGGGAVPGTVPFQWQPQPFAASYTIEVYANNDTAFSASNRVFVAVAKNPSYAWKVPVPASDQPYVWRVRRNDVSNNPGPWSAPGKFVSLGSVPQLLAPAAGSWQRGVDVLLKWSDVPGAASYSLVATSDTGGRLRVSTVATSYAPPSALASGLWTWTVAALDAAGNPLGTSPSRTFKSDATSPEVVKVGPATVTRGTTLKVVFSERVTGADAKTLTLVRQGSGKVKAKVTVGKKGKIAKIDPRKRLRPGTYVLKVKNAKIKDRRGNPLLPYSWSRVIG